MKTSKRVFVPFCLVVLCVPPAHAQTALSGAGILFADGTMQSTAATGLPGEEIDQACGEGPGCFTGDAPGFPVTITQPGIYRLVSPLAISTAVDAIVIQVDAVTLDLSGFVIDGAGVGLSGVSLVDRSSVEIRNGFVRDFTAHGVAALGEGEGDLRLIGVRVEGNGEYGIYVDGNGGLVTGCHASGNGASGIRIADGGSVVHSTANGNTDWGILGSNATLAYNTASGNGLGGIRGVASNILGNTANENVGSGIDCFFGTVKENTVISNNSGESSTRAGIRIQQNCQVLQNNVQANHLANIRATSSGSVIEENLLWNSGAGGCGLCLTGSGNFYANNRARGNATDYDIAAGNTDGGGNVSY